MGEPLPNGRIALQQVTVHNQMMGVAISLINLQVNR